MTCDILHSSERLFAYAVALAGPVPAIRTISCARTSGSPENPLRTRGRTSFSLGHAEALIAKLGLSQERAGLWLGLSRRQGQRYAPASRRFPEPVAKLLRLVISLDLAPIDVD
jgi:hypothetical protein